LFEKDRDRIPGDANGQQESPQWGGGAPPHHAPISGGLAHLLPGLPFIRLDGRSRPVVHVLSWQDPELPDPERVRSLSNSRANIERLSHPRGSPPKPLGSRRPPQGLGDQFAAPCGRSPPPTAPSRPRQTAAPGPHGFAARIRKNPMTELKSLLNPEALGRPRRVQYSALARVERPPGLRVYLFIAGQVAVEPAAGKRESAPHASCACVADPSP